jgi:hypothetical protein
VESLRQIRSPHRLDDDEAYCVTCHRPAKLLNPTRVLRGKHCLLQGQCQDCGKSIIRGVSLGQSPKLSTGV